MKADDFRDLLSGRRRWLLGTGAAALGAAWPAAFAAAADAAADYPAKPVRLIPFGSPGGPVDVLARFYAERLNRRWGQPIVVETKAGASGILAADAVAKSPPDGYTLMLTLALTHTTVPLLMKKVPYDPIRDFQPLTQVGTGGPMLVVPAANPATDLKSLVAWARQRKSVTYGTWGNGSYAHIMGEQFKRQAGIPLEHVPYKAEGTLHIDMFGGTLDMGWANPATAKVHQQAGKMKILAVAGSSRLPVLPEVRTFTEQGYKGFDLDSWWGFVGPAGMPAPLVTKLATALQEVTQILEVKRKLIDLGLSPLGNTPQQFAANLKADAPKWARLIQDNDISIE